MSEDIHVLKQQRKFISIAVDVIFARPPYNESVLERINPFAWFWWTFGATKQQHQQENSAPRIGCFFAGCITATVWVMMPLGWREADINGQNRDKEHTVASSPVWKEGDSALYTVAERDFWGHPASKKIILHDWVSGADGASLPVRCRTIYEVLDGKKVPSAINPKLPLTKQGFIQGEERCDYK